MFDILVVATCHYTGTHSIMNFLDTKGYQELANTLIYTKQRRLEKSRSKIYAGDTEYSRHIWIPELVFLWPEIEKYNFRLLDHPVIVKDKVNIIHGHIIPDNMDVLKELNYLSRIIVTVRDPLAALISCKIRDQTKKNRKEDIDPNETSIYMEQCLKEWELFATEIPKLKPYYVPVDLDLTGYKYRGIDFGRMMKYEPVSSRGYYDLKAAYKNKELDKVKDELKQDYDKFIELRPALQPVLEEIGYKDLLWWS
jgi:hypothetical protein